MDPFLILILISHSRLAPLHTFKFLFIFVTNVVFVGVGSMSSDCSFRIVSNNGALFFFLVRMCDFLTM